MIEVIVRVSKKEAGGYGIVSTDELLAELLETRVFAYGNGLDGYIRSRISMFSQVKSVEVNADWRGILNITVIDMDKEGTDGN